MASGGLSLPKIPCSPVSYDDKGLTSPRSSSVHCNAIGLEDSGVDVSMRSQSPFGERMLRRPQSSGESSFKDSRVHVEERTAAVSPVPPPQYLRKSSDVVRITKADLQRKDNLVTSLQEENTKLQSRLRSLQQNATVLEEFCEGFKAVSSAVSLPCDGLASSSGRAAVLDRVQGLVGAGQRTAKEAGLAQERAERLAGEAAEQRQRADGLASELDCCRLALKQAQQDCRLASEDRDKYRQTLAGSSAQLESVRRRLKDAEEKQCQSLRPSTAPSSLEEVSALQSRLRELQLQTALAEDSSAVKDSRLLSLQQELLSSQQLLSELVEELCAELGLSEQDATPSACLQQVARLQSTNEELTLRLQRTEEQRAVAEAGSKANRETILRLVSEAREHETALLRVAKLEQERDAAFAARVSAEHDREEARSEVGRVRAGLGRAGDRAEAQERQAEGARRELQLCREQLSTRDQEYADLLAAVGGAVGREGCSAQDLPELLTSVGRGLEELGRVRGREAGLEAGLDRAQRSLAELTARLAARDEEAGRRDRTEEGLRGELSSCQSQLQALETLLGRMQQLQAKQDGCYQQVARAMRMGSETVGLLTGEFAVDALVARGEQLALRETRDVSEKQASIYTLQRKLKSTRQALESKEVLVSLLQRKQGTLEQRLASHSQQTGQPAGQRWH